MNIALLQSLREGPWGGGNQLLKALRHQWQAQGIYVDDPRQADVILTNSFPFGEYGRFRQAAMLRRQGKTIIHRFAGPFALARDHGEEVDALIYRYFHLVGDGAIFQSQWSRGANHEQGLRQDTPEAVILNAPDPRIFYPAQRSPRAGRKLRVIATSWSTNSRKGFDIYEYLDEHLDMERYEMVYVGKSPRPFHRLRQLEPRDSARLAEELRRSDIFITASLMEACSNALIEAMHCGCVPVARDNTSHPEIVGDKGVLYQGPNDVLHAIDRAAAELDAYRQRELGLPDVEQMAAAYAAFASEVQDRVSTKPRPSWRAISELDLAITRWRWRRR